MQSKILNIQTKGQIMLPKSWRDELGANAYQAVKEGDLIILKPLHTASHQEIKKAAAKVMAKNAKLLKALAE